MAIKRILVPIDFSPPSLDALAYGVGLAKTFGAAVEVCFVVETAYFGAPGRGQAIAAMIDAQNVAARAALAALQRRYLRRGVRLRTAALTGAPAAAICEAASRGRSDLIVVATHGRSGLSRFLLGSVAERLVRTAPCAVMTFRGGKRRQRPAKRRA